MINISAVQWKRAREGARRGLICSCVQQNRFIQGLSVQEYWADFSIIMIMATDEDGNQLYQATQQVVDATSHIYIPTNEEYELWGELDLDIEQEIANRE